MIPGHLKINESSPFGSNKKPDIRKTKMGEIVKKIKKVDQSLSRAVALFRQKNNKVPNELDLMKDSAAVPLITQRKRLVKQYEYLKQEVQFAENTYQTIRGDNPVHRAKKSFQGIRASSPFSGKKEYRDTIATPALSPIRRVGTNSNKIGTLWDPRFNAGDVTVDPKIARYYRRLTGGY
tara:strand:+ start:267 stop:803 length:537 start_codon:yes stop_codon:yes gene_type:complete